MSDAQTDEIDLLAIGDEELIGLYRGGTCPGARNEVVLRHFSWIKRVAAMYANNSRLRRDLSPDAKQIAGMALLEAMAKYDMKRAKGPDRCSFRSFLVHVFRNRFRDFLKITYRAERRYDRSFAASAAIEEGPKTATKR